MKKKNYYWIISIISKIALFYNYVIIKYGVMSIFKNYCFTAKIIMDSDTIYIARTPIL